MMTTTTTHTPSSFWDNEVAAQRAALSSQNNHQPTQKLRVAVVGAGIGKAHVSAYQALNDYFELVAFCDMDETKADAVAAQHAIGRVAYQLEDLCAMDDLDVIDLCTPPWLHFAQIQSVLQAGKNAICEKPLVGSLAEVDALRQLEAQTGRWIMPIFQYRFGHGAQKLKYLIELGLAGRAYVSTVETHWRRRAAYYDVLWRGKWQTELGGAILGHAIHLHDLLTYLLGPVQQIFAHTATYVNPIEVDDCAAATLRMSDGSFASLSVTLGSSQEISRHRFCFSQLVAESHTAPYTNSADPWQFIGDTPELQKQIEEALSRFVPQPEGYIGQFLRLHQALSQGAALPVTLADARAALEVITAIYHSSETGQAVQLPIGVEHPMYAGWQEQTAQRE